MVNSTENSSQIVSADLRLQLTFLFIQIIVLILEACGVIVPRNRPADLDLKLFNFNENFIF